MFDMSPSSTSSTPEAAPPSAVEHYLVGLAGDISFACNARNWDRKSYPWTQFSSDFVCTTASGAFAAIPKHGDLQCMLNTFEALFGAKPEYHVYPTQINALVDEKSRKAQVYLNLEKFGWAPGIVRHSFVVLDFRQEDDGRWLCTGYEGCLNAAAGGGMYGSV